uniref:Malate dehydrogenase n=1 Tax=Lepeophtheirus salmonis TaxID=72036 RepID=D3PI42_LEPSM|nr:Malate dehydrogenase [Lepeophtheirus salmonis]
MRIKAGILRSAFESMKGKVSHSDRLIPKDEVNRFMIDSLSKVGCPHDHSLLLSDLLLQADYRGHFSHGLNRFEMYVDDIRTEMTDPKVTPAVLKETPSTAWVDGQNGLGVVVGDFCMKLAIQKAKDSGIGLVSAKGSNHFGMCQWYSEQALNDGLIGLSFTNTSPLATPTRSKDRLFGTNPLCISAPGLNGDYFTLDMATTTVALGKIEMQRRKNEELPSLSWALGADGHPTRNADEAFNNGCGLMPLGGSETNSGYKGYGLAMMVELLCGVLADAQYGPFIRKWMNRETPGKANLGQCFISINPQVFGEGFSSRLQVLMDVIRHSSPADDSLPVLVPGDPETAHRRKVDSEGGFYIQKITLFLMLY